MNVKPGWPGAATVRHGSSGFAARVTRMRGRLWAGVRAVRSPAAAPERGSGDVPLDGLGPTPLWSSMMTRAIHRFEELTMLLIMLHFAVGTLALLLAG
jgi:hypothetical protein